MRRVSPAAPGPTLVRVDDLEIDVPRRQVTQAGETVHLTRTELELLELLVRHPGKLLTQEFILREVWGPDTAPRATISACTSASSARSSVTRPRIPA